MGSWFGRKRYKATRSVHYRCCVLRINRRGILDWNNFQLGSGFAVELVYEKNITLAGDAIGLNDEFELTGPLAKFFSLNEALVQDRLRKVEDVLLNYRRHHRRVCRWKSRTLTYGFLSRVYDQPREVHVTSLPDERDSGVCQLMRDNGVTLKGTYKRLKIVSRSETTAWWYLFWVTI